MDQLTEICMRPEIAVLMEILRLSNMEAYEHSFSVAELVERMFPYTHYAKEEETEILIGALLHDIGKAFIPLNLTQLPHGLSQQEYNIIKVHTAVSYEIVKVAFPKIVQDICLYHHEKPDGSGYLQGIALRSIPSYVLMVQVADVFDALTRPRSYKKEYPVEKALSILRSEASKLLLDDEYVNILEQALHDQYEEQEERN